MKKKSNLLKIILAGTSLILAIATISVQIRTKELANEKEALAETLESYQNAIAQMEYDLLLPKEQYIEKYLRDILDYHKQDEIIFKGSAE